MPKVYKTETENDSYSGSGSDSDSDSEESLSKIGGRDFINKEKSDLNDTLSSSSSDGEDLIKFANMSIASKKKIISRTKSKLFFCFKI